MKKYKLVFDDLFTALQANCSYIQDFRCDRCPLFHDNASLGMTCVDFMNKYPDKAAVIMGVEVIDEDNKDEKIQNDI